MSASAATDQVVRSVRSRSRLRPLTPVEELFLDAYLSTGDVQVACEAAGIPAANGPQLLSRPYIKRYLDAHDGLRPAAEMDTPALLEEILGVARSANKNEAYTASINAYRLFFDVRATLKEPIVINAQAMDETTEDLIARLRSHEAESS